jgi:hypothetical protein
VRMKSAHRSIVLFVSCLTLLATSSSVATAKAVVANYIKATASADGDFKLYNYATGSTTTYDTQAELATGTMVGTNNTNIPGSVMVNSTAAPWWDPTFTQRRCYSIDHTAAGASTVTEYPISVTVDSASMIAAGLLQSTGADFRAIDSTGTTVLPLWIEGALNTSNTVIWTQIPTITAGATTSFCLYFGKPTATTVSNQLAPFTYTTPKPVYYPVDTNTPASTLNVATFGAGNSVQTGATTLPLATAGATASFPLGTATATGPVLVKGPINGRATLAAGIDSIVPISFAGTNFVIPIRSNPGTALDIFSPFASATVTVVVTRANGVAISTTNYTVAAGAVASTVAFPTNAGTAVVTSTKPVMVTGSNTGTVSQVGIPAAATTWYGVMPTGAEVSLATPGSTTYIRSTGVTATLTSALAGERLSSPAGSSTNGGAGTEGITFTSSQPIEPLLKSGDAATFMPLNELSNSYVLPIAADYVSFVCPTVGTQIKVGALITVPCATSGAGPFPVGTPGKALYNPVVAVPAGTFLESVSGEPFYTYYAEPGGRETNLWGPKQGRQVTFPAPVIAVSAVTAGTWESPAITTGVTGVFGTISWNGRTPTGTSVTFKVASATTVGGPWTYVGPDDTAGTSYSTSPGAIPFSFDGRCCIRILATLTPSAAGFLPALNDVTIRYNLTQLVHGAGTPSVLTMTAPIGVATTAYLVRVKTASTAFAGSTATVRELGTSTSVSNLASANARFEQGSVNQVVVTTGAVTTSVGGATTLDATTGRSVVLTAQPTASAITTTLNTRLVLDVGPPGGSPLIENDLDLRVVAV